MIYIEPFDNIFINYALIVDASDCRFLAQNPPKTSSLPVRFSKVRTGSLNQKVETLKFKPIWNPGKTRHLSAQGDRLLQKLARKRVPNLHLVPPSPQRSHWHPSPIIRKCFLRKGENVWRFLGKKFKKLPLDCRYFYRCCCKGKNVEWTIEEDNIISSLIK